MSRSSRYSIQWDEETRLLVERATLAGGYPSKKAYITQLVQREARKELERYGQIKMTTENFERFMTCSQVLPTSNAKFVKLAKTLARDGISPEQ